MFATIDQALEQFRNGGMVVVVDDEDRENEGDICMSASHVTPEAIAFMARQASGLICVALSHERIAELGLPAMVAPRDNRTPHGTAFTVSVEAATGVTTGISAHDRARTIALLADPQAGPDDFVTPGHIFPLRARPGGVLERPGHTEAGVELARLAGGFPAAVICEVMGDDGSMLRLPELETYAARHNLPLINIAQLQRYIVDHTMVRPVADTTLPTKYGRFNLRVYEDRDGGEQLLLWMGEVDKGDAPLARLHSECLTGDTLGSQRCDCGDQLSLSMSRIAEEGRGLLMYLRQEGRGIGLTAKIRAYALQDKGYDTVEANHKLGYPTDARDYTVGVAMLRDLNVSSIRLMTNNPDKVEAFHSAGVQVVERVPLQTQTTAANRRYLRVKRSKLGHLLDRLDCDANLM